MYSSDNDMVSIVIPTYDRTTYLSEAIDSALDQTYKNIEIIIVDDSSNDEVKKLCDSYGEKLRYFRRSERGGIASAINFAFTHMKGVWYKWMSDDDILPSNAIETFMKHANKNNALILYPNLEYIDEDGELVGLRIQEDFDDQYKLATLFWLQQIVISASQFIHRSCFDVVGYFENNYGAAFDYKWCLKACLVHDYRFYHIPEVLYKFRIHRDQASMENLEHHMILINKIREEVRQQMIKENPEKWHLFESNIQQYQKIGFTSLDSRAAQIRMKIRKHAPRSLLVLKWRFMSKIIHSRFINKIIYSRRELVCKICGHWGKRTYMYYTPGEDRLICKVCHTQYSGKSLERMLNSTSSYIPSKPRKLVKKW